jgi:hypothetical protein
MSPIYDMALDCAQDWTPNLDVERQAADTGAYEPYAGLSGVTMLLSATRGSATPIHASLSKSSAERAGTPGRLYATFDVADLQTHVLPYRGTCVWLNVFKSGELQYEPFRVYVQGDRLGD